MDNRIKKLIAVVCYLALPILIYGLVVFVVASILQALLFSMEFAYPGLDSVLFLRDNLALLYSGLAAVFISIVFGIFYHRLKQLNKASDRRVFSVPFYSFAALLGVFSAVFFNLLLDFSGLTRLFPAQQTADALPNASLLLSFPVTCLILPAAEELIFRGIGYLQLRRYLSFLPAAFLTSAAFGLFHGGISQGLYGFLMGLLLAHVTECFQTYRSALIFHISANLTSFFLWEFISYQILYARILLLILSGVGSGWTFMKISVDKRNSRH